MGYKKLETLSDKPWERQESESGEQYRMFLAFRDSEPKATVSQIAEKYKKSTSTTSHIAVANKWQERRNLWIDYQGQLITEELTREIPKMRKKHTDIATAMLVKALEGVKNLPAAKLSPKDLTTMIDTAVKLERLSRGEVTEKTENKTVVCGGLDLNQKPCSLDSLSDEELQKLDELLGKIPLE